jgi:type II secretory pathway pseudopilin PulG
MVMRRRADKLQNCQIPKLQNRRSRGYILITLMLFLTLLAIAAVAALPEIALQIKRDREEEMTHRAVGYSRAIRKYYKKFGRYPARLEDLENTNNLRFLRKRYTDPMNNNKEFKLLRQGDPALLTMGIGQGVGPGLAQAPGQGQAPGANSPFVGVPGGGIRPAGPADANAPQVTGLPGQQTTGTPGATGDDSGNADTPVDAKTAASSSSTSASSPGLGTQLFGGGPILGVASLSKQKTVREFCNKSHYNDWPFIYDPSTDRGGMLSAPYCPNLNQGVGGLGQAGQAVQPGPGPVVKPATQPAPGPTPEPPTQEPPEQ